MNNQVDSPRLQAIASMLSREICDPIDSLQANLVRLLDDPLRLSSPTERTHASTMLTLCEDLRRLTQEYLGDGPARGSSSAAVAAADGDATRPTPA